MLVVGARSHGGSIVNGLGECLNLVPESLGVLADAVFDELRPMPDFSNVTVDPFD